MTCPNCSSPLVRDGVGNLVHKHKPGGKPWARCTPIKAATAGRSDR